MSSPPHPSPPSIFPSGRIKWLWLAVAAVLGLWLVLLLVTSGSEEKTPFEAAQEKTKPFDASLADAFSKRTPVKFERRLAPFPVLPDQRKSE